MLKCSVAFISAVLLVTVNCQSPDFSWCNITALSNRKLEFNATGKYQALIERNDLFALTTEERREWFDSVSNIGVAWQTSKSTLLKTYSYYGINELLAVYGNHIELFYYTAVYMDPSCFIAQLIFMIKKSEYIVTGSAVKSLLFVFTFVRQILGFVFFRKKNVLHFH